MDKSTVIVDMQSSTDTPTGAGARAGGSVHKATLMTSRRLCLALSSVCLPARPNASYLRLINVYSNIIK